jgi:hypothetical protein
VRSEPPVDLSIKAEQAGLDVWRAATLIAQQTDDVAIVDIRSKSSFEQYHIPRSLHKPKASVSELQRLASRYKKLIVVAKTDNVAKQLVGGARKDAQDTRFFYLLNGPRNWYLNFDLPVPLFATKPPAFGYEQALQTAKLFFAQPKQGDSKKVLEAIQTLSRINYQPSLLQKTGPAGSTTSRKKVSGGCS